MLETPAESRVTVTPAELSAGPRMLGGPPPGTVAEVLNPDPATSAAQPRASKPGIPQEGWSQRNAVRLNSVRHVPFQVSSAK